MGALVLSATGACAANSKPLGGDDDDTLEPAPEREAGTSTPSADASATRDAAPPAEDPCAWNQPFLEYAPVLGLENEGLEGVPWVSPDEKVVAFSRNTGSGPIVSLVATRADAASAFTVSVLNLLDPGGAVQGGISYAREPSFNAAGSVLPYTFSVLDVNYGTQRLGGRSAAVSFSDAGAVQFTPGAIFWDAIGAWSGFDGRMYFARTSGATGIGLAVMDQGDFFGDAGAEAVTLLSELGADARAARTNHAGDELYYTARTAPFDGPFFTRLVDGRWTPPARIPVPRPTLSAVAGVSADGCRVYLVDARPVPPYASSRLFVARRAEPALPRPASDASL